MKKGYSSLGNRKEYQKFNAVPVYHCVPTENPVTVKKLCML